MSKTSRRFEGLSQLIDEVYEAALDEERWSPLAPQIARVFGSTSTTLQVRHGDSSRILSMTDNVASGIEEYRAYYWQRDLWVERALELLGPSCVGSSKDMVGDAEFQESEFYRDWCRGLDVFYVVGAVFPSGCSQLGVLGIHRPRSAGNYEEDDKALVSRFLPHLQRALRVRERLAQAGVQRHLSLDALDRSDAAVILAAADGTIIYANREAEAMMRVGDGIRSANGRLTARTGKLLALIRGACNRISARGDGIMMIERAQRAPLSVLVAPLRYAWCGQPAAGAIVFARDPEKAIPVMALRALFKLTPVEARIAQALVSGKTVAEIASAHGATQQTVRKQVKSVCAKTGTNRQAQCVSAILRTIATFVRE